MLRDISKLSAPFGIGSITVCVSDSECYCVVSSKNCPFNFIGTNLDVFTDRIVAIGFISLYADSRSQPDAKEGEQWKRLTNPGSTPKYAEGSRLELESRFPAQFSRQALRCITRHKTAKRRHIFLAGPSTLQRPVLGHLELREAAQLVAWLGAFDDALERLAAMSENSGDDAFKHRRCGIVCGEGRTRPCA